MTVVVIVTVTRREGIWLALVYVLKDTLTLCEVMVFQNCLTLFNKYECNKFYGTI